MDQVDHEGIMAEIKTGIFAKNVQKRLNRAQEKVLQKLGKADETKDEQFEQVVVNFRRQESEGSRLQREMKAYMSQASINLTQSLHEVYEPDWHGKDDIMVIGKDCDAMWEDFHNKLVDSTLLNLDEYLLQFPDLKTRVAKRSRKLIDYDSARHHVETLQVSGMKNDRKMMKADEELKKAQKVFEELNVGLQDELPTLWDSRVGFYISTYKSVTNLEARFHREISQVCRQLYEVMTQLAEQHSDKMFTIQGAPSDSGPLRLARTPSPTEDESPPESPDAIANHMLRPVSPGPPRPKSPIQLKKGPPVPPPPKATPTKEVAEEQIINLFGGDFLPAPSLSQPNERPGESLLDMDFDAFQPDESVSPIPQVVFNCPQDKKHSHFPGNSLNHSVRKLFDWKKQCQNPKLHQQSGLNEGPADSNGPPEALVREAADEQDKSSSPLAGEGHPSPPAGEGPPSPPAGEGPPSPPAGESPPSPPPGEGPPSPPAGEGPPSPPAGEGPPSPPAGEGPPSPPAGEKSSSLGSFGEALPVGAKVEELGGPSVGEEDTPGSSSNKSEPDVSRNAKAKYKLAIIIIIIIIILFYLNPNHEKMPIPSVVIEPASSNEGDDDRDADIISPTAISDNGVTLENQTIKHMSPSGGVSGLPDDFLYKVGHPPDRQFRGPIVDSVAGLATRPLSLYPLFFPLRQISPFSLFPKLSLFSAPHVQRLFSSRGPLSTSLPPRFIGLWYLSTNTIFSTNRIH
uniref:BAR domain-containing protein n=1 Tax=Gasterosteus aculeatus aculeatus TaxID=481459 RepID=G3NDG6_GASAC